MCDKGVAMQPNSKIHLIKITLKITVEKHPQFLWLIEKLWVQLTFISEQ